ncbi:MAG: hypothetical protein JW892_09950 [Anaerolineae bacterium]|nr:hypothetical protein [Anaerolineae bacterium]
MSNVSSRATISARREPAVWILALLLTIQGLSFTIAAVRLLLIPEVTWMVHLPWFGDVLPVSQMVGGISATLAALTLITALGCIRLTPIVWLNAMAAQGITLLTLLLLYFNRFTEHLAGQGIYRYIFFTVMAYAVFMVFFLSLVVRQIAYHEPALRSARR